MNSTRHPSIPIRRLCSQRSLSRTPRSRSGASGSFFPVTCPVQFTFLLVVASIHDVPWHRISAVKLNLPLKRKRGESITLHVISPKELLPRLTRTGQQGTSPQHVHLKTCLRLHVTGHDNVF